MPAALHNSYVKVSFRSCALLAAALAFFAAGCKSGPPPSKPLSQLTPTEQSGRAVFQTHCAACHYPTSTDSLHGPGLQALFKRPYLPSGAPANDDRVSAVILHGRNMMPPMGNQLDDQQMQDLLAYLHTL
ncbi:MAG: c-type cytochrome [Acidobacteriaceae bacterium]